MTETINAGLVRLALVRLRRDIDAELDRRDIAATLAFFARCARSPAAFKAAAVTPEYEWSTPLPPDPRQIDYGVTP